MNTPRTNACIVKVFGLEIPTTELIKVARELETELAKANSGDRPYVVSKKATRPRVPQDIKRLLSEAPPHAKGVDLAKAFGVSSSTVSKYRRVA